MSELYDELYKYAGHIFAALACFYFAILCHHDANKAFGKYARNSKAAELFFWFLGAIFGIAILWRVMQ